MRMPSLRSNWHRSSNECAPGTVKAPETSDLINGAANSDACPTASPSASVRPSSPISSAEIGPSSVNARRISMLGTDGYRLGKEAMDMIGEQMAQAKRDSAGGSAHAAWEIDKEWVCSIHVNSYLLKLLLKTKGRHAVAEEQVLGILIIHEIGIGTLLCLRSPCRHCGAEVTFMHDPNPSRAHVRFFHSVASYDMVYCGLKAQCRGHDPNAQSQIAGRPHGNMMPSENASDSQVRRERVDLLRLRSGAPAPRGSPHEGEPRICRLVP